MVVTPLLALVVDAATGAADVGLEVTGTLVASADGESGTNESTISHYFRE